MVRALVTSLLKASGETSEKFSNTLSQDIKGVKNIKLLKAFIPRGYPILVNFNDSFQLNYGGSNYIVTITPQYYDGYQLATELTSLFATATGTSDIVISYTDRTEKLTLATTADSFDLSASVVSSPVQALLGLQYDTSVLNSTSTTFPNKINLGFPHVLFMNVNCFGHNSENVVYTQLASYSYVFMTENESPGENMVFQELSNYIADSRNRNNSVKKIQIEFIVNDTNGVPLSIGNSLFDGKDCGFIFEFY